MFLIVSLSSKEDEKLGVSCDSFYEVAQTSVVPYRNLADNPTLCNSQRAELWGYTEALKENGCVTKEEVENSVFVIYHIQNAVKAGTMFAVMYKNTSVDKVNDIVMKQYLEGHARIPSCQDQCFCGVYGYDIDNFLSDDALSKYDIENDSEFKEKE